MKLKQIFYLFADMFIVMLSVYFAALLRFDGNIPLIEEKLILTTIALSLFIFILYSLIFGCYKIIWVYIGFEAVFRQITVSVLTMTTMLVVKYITDIRISGSITVISTILLFVLTIGIRSSARVMRWIKAVQMKNSQGLNRVIIVGAGNSGAMVIKHLSENFDEKMMPVAVLDDDEKKIGLRICGILVAGKINEVESICKSYKANEIILAIPSASKQELSEIYLKCATTSLPIKIFQNVIEIDEYLSGNSMALKEITLEELLVRDTFKGDSSSAKLYLKGKTVMVTGGAGSIGQELCRQILECGCENLIIFDISENGLFEINEELKQIYKEDFYKLCLGSIRDYNRLETVIGKYRPDILYHAAAHKHVPMMEINPFEAVKNNVMGTLNVVNCAIRNSVQKFILVSSDKAVNTPNIMGATKRIGELIVKNMDGNGCELCAVRFGNVLGSMGSVIPLFKKQIESGGPVTVTHKDIKRYFMTIPEAVRLLLITATFANGSEIFVLDMGASVKIYDLAYDLIKMTGLRPNIDIEIKITGLRPGEKLKEELFFNYESVDKTSHEKILIVKSDRDYKEKFLERVTQLIDFSKEEVDEEILRECIFNIIE